MSGEKRENELSQWFSTYGAITAERILGRYQIKLAQSDLLPAIKNTHSFYHKLLEIPIRNVLNGIVLQQAHDYHVYAQKLFIDYLLSGENAKDETSQGASTREEIENERQQLITLGDEYNKKEIEHNNLIANSQAMLIKLSREFNLAFEHSVTAVTSIIKDILNASDTKNTVRKAINHAIIQGDLSNLQLESNQFVFVEKMNEIFKLHLTEEVKQQLIKGISGVLKIVLDFDSNVEAFHEESKEMAIQINLYRSQFYESVVRILDLMKALPEYKMNLQQDAINREPLDFDRNIGTF